MVSIFYMKANSIYVPSLMLLLKGLMQSLAVQEGNPE